MQNKSFRTKALGCAAIAVLITGCASGTGGQLTPTMQPGNDFPNTPPQTSAMTDESLLLPATRIFTANRNNGSVLAFSATASGNIVPAQSITGSNTTLTNPEAIALDASGAIYTANDSGTQVAVFAPGASGNVKPTRVIGGSNSHLGPTEGLLIDPSAHLWVTDFDNNKITEYPAGASGNVAPIRTIAGSNTHLVIPTGMAMDTAGRLFVANNLGASIVAFANTASGNAAPSITIKGTATHLSLPFALAFDSLGRLLVADQAAGILVFAKGAHDNAAPVARITGFAGAHGVVADASDHIWAADFFGNSIKEFAANANGNATPLRTIQGSNTTLSGASFLVLH
jgi:hypothetical protein